MQARLKEIPVKEVLHFLGWRGTPVEQGILKQIASLSDEVTKIVQPHVIIRRFAIGSSGALDGTSFFPQGNDVHALLSSCCEAVLLAATLGAQSERMLLRARAQGAERALLLDAVMSAAIEEVCDQAERKLREEIQREGLYLTDRFSPGYGDMPLAQTKEICEVFNAAKSIGLTVSHSGIMIPRKSVTAVMGVSQAPVVRRPRGCEACSMRSRCQLSCKTSS